MDKKTVLRLVSVGALAGCINGFFGSGGGIIAVFSLTAILGFSQKEAQATSIGAMLILSIISIAVYIFNGTTVTLNTVVFTGIGAIIGGFIGTKLMKRISGKVLKLIFAALLIFAGVRSLLV